VQDLGWPVIARGESCVLVAPTGSGKTLAAFLASLNRLMFTPLPEKAERCRVLYVSPLKALAVDVEKNLRAPIAGIANFAAGRGDVFQMPTVGVRTGDTPARERARLLRANTDILITTPESLYLLLTSRARELLRTVDTVIVDEIHALVPTKRGAHLALSLERLEHLTGRPLQRIGLSATQRPLDEVARFLGGAKADGVDGPLAYRHVTVVDAHQQKRLALRVEVPLEAMPRGEGPQEASLWAAIHPRLLGLIRDHTSTLVFVNNRRVAERLAGALNELAGETLVLAHHGSIAREQRLKVEDALKAGTVRGLVATSSLELGIDMGSVDLVVQVEAPPSVASGMQRIGRAGHQVDAISEGVIFPKFRGDLLSCAALTRAMKEGDVESTRYPRQPLDVLAQQVVAMVAMEPWDVEALYRTLSRAAPFVELSRSLFEGVLDLLSGRYASDDFAHLKPRLTWDRAQGTLSAREGAWRVAVVNGGTIPDRGLYPVYLVDAGRRGLRVGELDEEMVHESRVGDVFVLGASSWRIEEISADRVLVSPAPGQPGMMPFWRGDAPARPAELGRRVGALTRELTSMARGDAVRRLEGEHSLSRDASTVLLDYLAAQAEATSAVPDDRTLLIESCRDELGDWRVCVLSPWGGKVHAPWCLAVAAKLQEALGLTVETLWTNDGFVVRLPESEAPPDPRLFLPTPKEAERLVQAQLSASAMFAARFREASARALLLPRRFPGKRAPLWQQRKRAHDLLSVAARFPSFPLLLEAYRECLQDVFDMPALAAVLGDLERGASRVVTQVSKSPSPFAGTVLFGFAANYLYDGDAPLAERKAQVLTIDPEKLKELLGEAELRELLDPEVLVELEAQLQRTDPRFHARSLDGVHDLLLGLGDLAAGELAQRCESPGLAGRAGELVKAGRVLEVHVASEPRFIAVEDAARYRDGLGVTLPAGVPKALLAPVADARGDLFLRYARTHGPFTREELGRRLGLSKDAVGETVARLLARGRLLEGAFRPLGAGLELCEPEVLATVRRRSLARLRKEVEPAEPAVLARFLLTWHGVTRKGRGLDALLDAVEKLQGAPLPLSVLDSELLPARVEAYTPGDLDALVAAGEVVWCGVSRLGERDGRVALYLTDALPKLWRKRGEEGLGVREERILAHLRTQGASFFAALHQAAGGGFARSTEEALWNLAWRGLVTSDSVRALRSFLGPNPRHERKTRAARLYRSRRTVSPGPGGRWSLVESYLGNEAPGDTEWMTAQAQQLLTRQGLVTREGVEAENLPGGFSALYPVLKAMEESGRVRRGYFASGVGGVQFARPEVPDLLRALRSPPEKPEQVRLSAVDPANPYGTLLPWPARQGRTPARVAGAEVVLVNGHLAAYLTRGGRDFWTYVPEQEPERSFTLEALGKLGLSHSALHPD
jgi:ATP-dependent Lhr-like helicase